MKTTIALGLLLIWGFILIAPAVLTVADKYNASLVLTLGEEEQTKGSAWDADTKCLKEPLHFNFSLFQVKRANPLGYYWHLVSDPLSEIILPPPKFMA